MSLLSLTGSEMPSYPFWTNTISLSASEIKCSLTLWSTFLKFRTQIKNIKQLQRKEIYISWTKKYIHESLYVQSSIHVVSKPKWLQSVFHAWRRLKNPQNHVPSCCHIKISRQTSHLASRYQTFEHHGWLKFWYQVYRLGQLLYKRILQNLGRKGSFKYQLSWYYIKIIWLLEKSIE